jgi:hypothetical protein
MKKPITAALIISTLWLSGCEPIATFNKPQPEGVDALTSFPGRLQGQYLDSNGASVVTIADQSIVRSYEYDIRTPKDSLGLSAKTLNDTLMDRGDGVKEKLVVQGDTVIRHMRGSDTLFHISADNVLKKFKGYHFLNTRQSDTAWEVKKLSLCRGTLTVGAISTNNDIKQLKELTESNGDTTSTNFSLTRRQFRKFIRHRGFSEEETFTRVK